VCRGRERKQQQRRRNGGCDDGWVGERPDGHPLLPAGVMVVEPSLQARGQGRGRSRRPTGRPRRRKRIPCGRRPCGRVGWVAIHGGGAGRVGGSRSEAVEIQLDRGRGRCRSRCRGLGRDGRRVRGHRLGGMRDRGEGGNWGDPRREIKGRGSGRGCRRYEYGRLGGQTQGGTGSATWRGQDRRLVCHVSPTTAAFQRSRGRRRVVLVGGWGGKQIVGGTVQAVPGGDRGI
jgi:hypothetical protein